jgi:hypothetical protein
MYRRVEYREHGVGILCLLVVCLDVAFNESLKHAAKAEKLKLRQSVTGFSGLHIFWHAV